MPARTTDRRRRMREAALEEIHAAARRLLVEQGPAAVTINAVAREVGMSGPALYHYYAGHDELVGAVTAGFFCELAAEMERARDARPGAPAGERLLEACRAMRAWAVAHPAEFGWIFASPVAPAARRPDAERRQAGQRFEEVLLDLVADVWRTRPFPVPDPADLPASLRAQLTAYADSIGGRLPPEAAHVFLSCWIRLYGLLCMEVLHQVDFAYTDMEPVFEECLSEIAARLGLDAAERPERERDLGRPDAPSGKRGA
ncbi:TetR/AcrR family transcriptional regulator [Streptomonospora nanhaiensis]|uniref:AcrR family transcriptional regulator n=1 Tax=Streptomonospora nanhaiensis TaxID=1323731 RepID=A0A853BTJ6_9ACTN|nr:TetR/AcrR family transcriptional regulator [Streptomonospora nanhaiensis]MBV2364526.1 TetR/AcrR family transcriptional regulator [Streptomonospora nanhaiensis]MBX9388060.1 TetR/AcrR family transcriptional regulator [Streptomonospora nanhaiensis]NYI99129.1 AcrR family transcriptional regulator [Streptomonospora nanhaiensis]